MGGSRDNSRNDTHHSRGGGVTGHIGIIACSAEGAALCYRTICLEAAHRLGRHAHPEVSLHNHSLASYVACLERRDWPAIAELMLSSAHKLASSGAEFLICPDNTIHQAFQYLESRSPLALLNIADVVAEEAVARGFSRLGLAGTNWLLASDTYPGKLAARGLSHVLPSTAEANAMHRIIMDELVLGRLAPEGLACLQRIIERMRQSGCDAVVLGCTEIPLILNDGNSPLPTLDSTRLLARAALNRAIEATAPPA